MSGYRVCGIAAALALVSACSGVPTPAPVVDAGTYTSTTHGSLHLSHYVVQPGETLYFIAWRAGLDPKVLAAINHIGPPYTIYPGQRLKLKPSAVPVAPAPVKKVVKPAVSKPVTKVSTPVKVVNKPKQPTKALTSPNSNKTATTAYHNTNKSTAKSTPSKSVTPSNTSKKTVTATQKSTGKPIQTKGQQKEPKKASYVVKSDEHVKKTSKPLASKSTKEYAGPSQTTKPTRVEGPVSSWVWPTQGKVIKEFSYSDTGNKGIDIKGKRGQRVVAAANGRVVYAGSALRGYGKLIIIRHNDDYLSAYAHNSSLLVKEQQAIRAGQHIADMGNTGTTDTRLHFEIRYRGKSVDPRKFLPNR